jgi:hypothetical protein
MLGVGEWVGRWVAECPFHVLCTAISTNVMQGKRTILGLVLKNIFVNGSSFTKVKKLSTF